MRGNTITVYPRLDRTVSVGTLYQWDFGQRLIIRLADLPTSYEVHFAVNKSDTAVCETGDSTGVNIPDDLLEVGKDLFGWLYIPDGETGTTEYTFILKVEPRARPSTPRPEIIPAEGVDF